MTGIGSLIKSFFPKKAVAKATEEVVLNIAKEVPKVKRYLKPSETLAFSQKALKRDGFFQIADYVYRTDRDVAVLKSLNAPESLIKRAKTQYPLKLENGSLKWNTQKLESRITNKRNDAQIEKLFKNKAKEEQEYKQTLASLKHGYTNFEDTAITNPDEILKLIKSGEYSRLENSMLNRLSSTGNSTHAAAIMPEINKSLRELTKMSENESGRSNMKYAIAAKIKTVGLIGDEKQQSELINQLKTELKSNHDKDAIGAIFRGIAGIGSRNPKDAKYSEILLDELFTHNKKAVYEHLSNFDGQFHIIAKGMIDNPENSDILVAAYKSAKNPTQKQIFLNEILKSEELTNTAIISTSKFYMIDENKAFVADILSEIKAKKLDSLSTHYRHCLERTLNE